MAIAKDKFGATFVEFAADAVADVFANGEQRTLANFRNVGNVMSGLERFGKQCCGWLCCSVDHGRGNFGKGGSSNRCVARLLKRRNVLHSSDAVAKEFCDAEVFVVA